MEQKPSVPLLRMSLAGEVIYNYCKASNSDTVIASTLALEYSSTNFQ